MNTYLYRLPLLRQAARFIRRRIYGMPRVDLLERLPKHGICAEIGVHQGNFSQMIIDITKPRCLYLIDPWKHEPEEQFAVAFCGASVEQATMDKRCRSVQRRFRRRDNVIVWRAFSDDAGSYFSEEYLDWVYLDGNHLEAAIAKDLELYWPKIKNGGYICGDDYGVQGWWNNGVQKAVDSFVAARGLTLGRIATQFIIRKPADLSFLRIARRRLS